MSGISQPIKDILAKVGALTPVDLSGNTPPLFTRVWNNQYNSLEHKQLEAIPWPNAFVEVVMPNEYTQLGLGFTESDIIFRIHIGMWQADAEDGTMEQNLTIFDIRDSLIKLLTYYQPIGCGRLMKVNEEQDYSHTNIYHYVVDFKCGLIDSTGDITTSQITSGPPTSLTIIAAYAVLEILNSVYNAGSLLITFRLLNAQAVNFTIAGVATFTAGTQPVGENLTYTITGLSLSGNYLLTGMAATDNFTTPAFNFTA